MKSKKKQKIVHVFFLLVLFFIGNYYLGNLINNKVNREIDSYTLTNLDILRTSGYWNLSPFVIDDSTTGVGAHNWTWAETQPWCSGSGTFKEPYLIENVTIDGGNSGSCITIINSDKYFRIENCTFFNSGSGTYDAGIHLDYVGNGTLIDNNCSFNNKYGISLYYSYNTTVSGNTANNNSNFGIYLSYSDNTVVSGNTANNNSYYGIILHYSNNNTVVDNTANNQDTGISIIESANTTVSGNTANNNSFYGINLSNSDNTIVSGNTANNNSFHGIIILFSNGTTVSGNTANSNSEFGIYLSFSNITTISGNTANNNSNFGILLNSSDNNTVSGNTANNNSYYGIFLYCSNNNTVSGNTFDNNQDNGIYLSFSNGTTVSGNIVDNNVNYGIYVSESDYNLIYKNYFINNGIHALDSGNFNNWNSSIIGNYWDNYTGYDDDFDGIGDTAHNFVTGIDYLPIWTFQSPIHIDDSATGLGGHNWTWAESQPWCSGSGTFSVPYIIDGLNITARGVGSSIMIENSYKYFKVQNCKLIESGSGIFDAGIHLDHVGNGTLINNNCSFNRNGISLYHSDHNTVSGNTANNNSYYGIWIYYYSDHNTISGNTANNNIVGGIKNNYSDNNTVSGNTANNNSYYGIYISYSNNSTVSGNTANNNTNRGIGLYFSNSTTVSGNTANNNSWAGIYISNSNNSTVSGNTANNNTSQGIGLYFSNSTTVSGNIIDNSLFGIYVSKSDYNLIYKNYFNDNKYNAYNNGTDNKWDNGVIGNYWDDYAGVDANDDGIGDTPYIILGSVGSQDNFPIWDDGDDISAPVITIIFPLPDSIFGLDAPNYNISIDELYLDTIWYTLDGGITNYTITDLTGTFNQLAWGALSEGGLTIMFYANDSAGNIDSAAVTVIKDVSAPVITIILPLTDSVFDLVAPYYNISIDELNLDTIWYTLDGGITNYTITDLTGTFNHLAWEALSEGSLTIRFYAKDTAGNIGFIDVEVIIEIPEDLDDLPIISFGNYYLLFTFITILSFVILEKRKKK